MPALTVNVEAKIIDWLLKQNVSENVESIMMDNILKWRTGEKKPTFSQIEALSKKTNIPLGYFFLKEPPAEEMSLLEYRTIDSLELKNPSRNLIDTVDSMERIQDWMKNYLIGEGYEELSYVGSQKDNTDVLKIAEIMRKDLELKDDWFLENTDSWDSFKKLRYKFANIGILVMMNGIVNQNNRRKLDVNEFRAFTFVDDIAPLIFINTNDSKSGKLFSLVHEAAHIWIGISSFFNDKYNFSNQVNEIEKRCNSITAEILAPNSIFVKSWNRYVKNLDVESKISNIAAMFNCGNIVIARRALDNNFINQSTYKRIVRETIEQYRENQEIRQSNSGGNYYNNLKTRIDNRFILALANSINEGKTSYTEAYRLTNTSRNTFSNVIDKIRGIEL